MSATGFTPIQLYYSTTAAATPSAGNLANGELAVNITDGKLFYKDNGGVVRVLATAAGSAGDVVGPGSSTDNALVRFDGTTGKLVQSSVGILSDAGALSGLTSVAATTFTGALTGNASTAITLQTSRTIWGQSFDGSANVTGALTGVTDLTASGSLTLNGGTANGVAYLNGSKVLTTGSALTFDGTRLTSTTGKFGGGVASNSASLMVNNATNTATGIQLFQDGIESWIMGMPANSAGLAWSASGTEQMRLTSTGLGIGTSSPGARLDVYSSGTTSTLIRTRNDTTSVYLDANNGYSYLNTFSNHPMLFGTNNAERMRIDSSGNVGIGTSSPGDYKLNVNGSMAIGTTTFNSIGSIELNSLGTGDRTTYIDFISSGSPGSVDFSSRIIRNAGLNGSLEINHKGSGRINFVSGDLQRACITSDGWLAVGGSDPGASSETSFTAGQEGAVWSNIASAVNTYHVYSTTTSSYRFYVAENGGILNYSGNNVNLSDERTKKNIEVAGGYLDKICAIPVKLFNYKDEAEGEQRTLGVIAQDVEAVAPEFVNNDGWEGTAPEDGVPLKTIYSTDMMFGMMKAIQELKAINDAQAKIITALTARVAALEAA